MKRFFALDHHPRPILDAIDELERRLERAATRAREIANHLARVSQRDRANRRKDPFIRQWKR